MSGLVTSAERDFYLTQTTLAKKQIELLEKQKEFVDLQRKDIEENKKDRKILNRFTFVLAFGIVISLFFNLFQMTLEFEKASTLHLLIISGIFIFLFLFYMGFLFHVFPMTDEMKSYFKKEWLSIIGLLIMILFLGWILFLMPDVIL